MALSILFFSLLWTSASGFTTNDCPKDIRDRYTVVHDDTCYRFVVYGSVKYQLASEYCMNKGGSLVVIKSKSVNSFITEELQKSYGYNGTAWIGLRYTANKGTLKWVDGTLIINPTSYTKFVAGSGKQDHVGKCVALDSSRDGSWQEYDCQNWQPTGVWKQMAFICEFSLSRQSTPLPVHPMVTTTGHIVGVTTPEPPIAVVASTVSTTSTKKSCPSIVCDLDCGLDGYKTDDVTHCLVCQCDDEKK